MHEGRYFVAHGGGIDGFISATGFLPKEKIGIVILTNSDSSFTFAEGLSRAILNQILGVTKEDWIPQAKEKEEKTKLSMQGREDNSLLGEADLIRPLNDYVGEFEHPGYGLIRVYGKGDHLVLSYNSLSIILTHKCYDHFVGNVEGMFELSFNCSFMTDHFGEISELHIPLEPALGAIPFKRKVGSELLTVDYLKQFEGIFENSAFSLNIALNGDRLIGAIPGTTEELVFVPEKPFQFLLKGMPGTTARFISGSDGKIAEMSFITPNGTLNFKVK